MQKRKLMGARDSSCLAKPLPAENLAILKGNLANDAKRPLSSIPGGFLAHGREVAETDGRFCCFLTKGRKIRGYPLKSYRVRPYWIDFVCFRGICAVCNAPRIWKSPAPALFPRSNPHDICRYRLDAHEGLILEGAAYHKKVISVLPPPDRARMD